MDGEGIFFCELQNLMAGQCDIDIVMDGCKLDKLLRSPTAKDLTGIMNRYGFRRVLYIQPVDHRTIEVGLRNG